MKRVLLWLIDFYRREISPLTPPTCRFSPTCSAYAREAVEVHGVWRGMWLALWRLLRCNPFSRGGFDPVPPRRDAAKPSDGGTNGDSEDISIRG